MSGSESRLLGRWGEALVADDLRRKGWTVEAAGWTWEQVESAGHTWHSFELAV